MEKTPEQLALEAKPEQKLGLSDRVDKFWAEKNDWKKINGGCAISPDVNATLKLLAQNVRPIYENLPAMIRASVEKRDKQGRKLEEIWPAKISEGANYVGVLDGVFHFFKGEEVLSEDNKELRFSALPAILQFRDKEKEMVRARTREAMAALRADFQQSEFGNFVGAAPVSAPPDPQGEVRLEGGSDIA